MGDYVGRIDIRRPAGEVFGYLSDIGNMPEYLPTVRRVERLAGEQVLVEGETDGRPYRAEGWFKIESARLMLSWGSDALVYYRGSMQVQARGEACRVELHLHLVPEPHVAQRMTEKSGSLDAAMTTALTRTLERIRASAEGTNGANQKRQAGAREPAPR